ncbi:hypothetical protein [Polaromonas sp. JS666]|uniref:hypothetical protein n=1 Tax=Polaromonas sp. (strain JS666 / ATCC BAA-500) TaxID=296591 RepID=UPI000884F189|nr:hypothetical protein [Polaromonas sp. JS666]SDM36592.1 hypothetical protein SAMN05720382_101112 [Polaromonas sp. JS666]
MDINDFKRILCAFADEQKDVDVRQGKVVASIRDDIIEANLTYSEEGNLLVEENEQKSPARTWLLTRIAKLPQLADRILAVTPEPQPFVTPSGFLVDDLAATAELDSEEPLSDVLHTLSKRINNPIPGATSVLYLTSDAGEGKTTLIGLAARNQAKQLKEKKAQRLLVPIPLGGKAFLTFDDAVISALSNRLRFQYLYYSAFLELVKLGAIVPAFDGYEEMLIENNKDEAVSALSDLIKSLDSKGSVLVAARKAFFEYQSFRTQARLLDALGEHSISFSRLKISRWSKTKFCEYGQLRGVADAASIYELVAARLSVDHPLLTRAVLVKRLFDISEEIDDRNELVRQLSLNPEDFFFNFVNVIIAREATEKWLNRSSQDVGEPLIELSEHHQLLREFAIEMWQSSTNSLKYDIVDLLVDLFCESTKKSALATRQIKERIKQHSLLVVDSSRGPAVAFDHEDFQNFFLGEGFGALLARGVQAEIRSLMSINVLPLATVEQSVRAYKRFGGHLAPTLAVLQTISNSETGYSYVKENCGATLAWLAEDSSRDNQTVTLDGVAFPANSLAGKSLSNVIFNGCTFHPTTIRDWRDGKIIFNKCHFERLDFSDQGLKDIEFRHCTFDAVMDLKSNEQIFEPAHINRKLRDAGGQLADGSFGNPSDQADDDRIWELQRFLRIFLRTTHVDEDVIKLRLGKAISPDFFKQTLPDLVGLGVLIDVPWKGGGIQKRYRLNIPLSELQQALEKAHGKYEDFLTLLTKPD